MSIFIKLDLFGYFYNYMVKCLTNRVAAFLEYKLVGDTDKARVITFYKWLKYDNIMLNQIKKKS